MLCTSLKIVTVVKSFNHTNDGSIACKSDLDCNPSMICNGYNVCACSDGFIEISNQAKCAPVGKLITVQLYTKRIGLLNHLNSRQLISF